MLKLTRETLANSSDDQGQLKAGERGDSLQCLETIAAMLRSHMPCEQVDKGTTSPSPSPSRDYRMTEGASASQSQCLQEGARHLLPARRVGRAPVDRTGRDALDDDSGVTQPHHWGRSGSFTSQCSPVDLPHSSQHKKLSPPALVVVGSSDEEDAEVETRKTVVDNWLEVDTREASRKRQRERLPLTGISSLSKRSRPSGVEGSAPQTTTPRQGSLRLISNGKGLPRRASSEQPAGEDSDLSFGSDQLSPPSSATHLQPVVASPLPRGPSWDRASGAPPPAPPTSHMRVRVTIEHKTFLIPCPVRSSPALSFAWLAAEASSRYSSQMGRRPRLALATQDGAQLCLEDVITDVLGHNEEVVGVVEGWDLPPVSEQYKACCAKAGQGETRAPRESGLCSVHRQADSAAVGPFQSSTALLVCLAPPSHIPLPSPPPLAPHFKVARLLKDTAAVCLAGVHLTQVALQPVLQCLCAQDSLTEVNLQGTKLGQNSLLVLGGVLLSLPRLFSLDLSCCMVTALGLSALVSSMEEREGEGSLHSLRQLSLSYNHLEGAEGSLALLVDKAPALRNLHIEHCSLQLAGLLRNSTAGE